jgi:CheY-like chemotaxis protein
MNNRILIVDDNIQILNMLQASVQVFCPKSQVTVAEDGAMALRKLNMAEVPFDLIITHYEMPIVDGLTLTKAVNQKWPNTRIVLISSYSLNILDQDIQDLKLSAYLTKPFSLKQLKKAIFIEDKIPVN